MSLKVGSFPVSRLELGSENKWDNGALTIDATGLAEMAGSVKNITGASVEIVSPGESARIIHVNDVLEPRVKVEGPGTVFPGVCNRPVDPVGSGVTHRFSGLALVHTAGMQGHEGFKHRSATAGEALSLKQNERPQDFIEMSGPGAVRPYSSLHNICINLNSASGLAVEDSHIATHTAAMKVSDKLASIIRDLTPPEVEEFDTSVKDPSLPGIVSINNLASSEHHLGPDTAIGTAVYGVTRLSAPWLVQPEEMLDGAVSQRISWHFTNNPLTKQLISRHGKDLNYLGAIIQRTNWGAQRDMQMSAARSAQIARMLGADGAIITTNLRGRRFIDTILGVQACEKLGINTTLMTEEEDDENGNAPPLLVFTPEMKSIVTTGAGAAGPFPPVERVLGARDGDAEPWSQELPSIAGRYGSSHVQDYYGYGHQSRVDY